MSVIGRAALASIACGAAVLWIALAVVFAATSGGEESPVAKARWAEALGIVGGPFVLPLVTAVLAAALAGAGQRSAARFLLLAVGGAGLLTYLLKGVLQVLGADHDGGRLSDYPSGHEAATVSLLLALVAIAWPYVTGWAAHAAAVVLALGAGVLMGSSRVAAGAHTPLDVLGGAVLAVGWVAVCLLEWPPVRART